MNEWFAMYTIVSKNDVLHNNERLQWRIQDFPVEGEPTPRGGAPTYDFAKFSQKLHEIKRIWASGAPLMPP